MLKNPFRRRRKPLARLTRKPFFEPLEDRRLLAVDLVADRIEAPSKVDQDVRFHSFLTVSNAGTTASPQLWKLEVRLEDFNGQLVANLGESTIPQLLAGKQVRFADTLEIPSSVADGVYRLALSVDPTNRVSETNESNNRSSRTLTVGSAGGGGGGGGGGGDDDLNDEIDEASSLDPFNDVRSRSATIENSRDVDMYSFTVQAGQRIGMDLDVPSSSELNGRLRLFNSSGLQLATNALGNAPDETFSLHQHYREAFIDYTFSSAGTYYLGVSGDDNDAYSATTGDGDKAESDIGSFSVTLTALGAANEIIVTTSADTSTTSDGVTSLREAITQANATPGEQTITFLSALGGAALRIT